MSAFLQGLKFGALTGILNNTFSSCFYMFNPISSWHFTPDFSAQRFSLGGFGCYSTYNQSVSMFENYSPPNIKQFEQNYMWQSFTPPSLNFNVQNSWNNFACFDTFTRVSMPLIIGTQPDVKKSSVVPEGSKFKQMTPKEKYDIFIKSILDSEGGYANHKSDKGGETNYGITHATYDAYRTRKKLSKQSVTKITMAEVHEIYYNDYFLASGADKIEDPMLALHVFDTAVNCGVGTAKKMYKKSNGSVEKYEELRRTHYRNIVARDSSQQVFLKGWLSRVNHVNDFVTKNIC